MHVYINITIYLPRFFFMFRCAVHHLQKGLLLFLLKTTYFFYNYTNTKYKLLTLIWCNKVADNKHYNNVWF
jgi:hypothetical protein